MDTPEIRKLFSSLFTAKEPRQAQVLAFDSLAGWLKELSAAGFKTPEHPYFALSAPTGTGKSHIAVTTARVVLKILQELRNNQEPELDDNGEVKPPEPPRVWIVTQNKLLQDQYSKDFPKLLFDLRGLDNYDCLYDPGKSCGESKCGRENPPKSGAELPENKPPKYCSKTCDYDIAMRKAKSSPLLLLNVAKAFMCLKMNFPKPDMILYDEAHNIENALDSQAGFSLTPKMFEQIEKQQTGFPEFSSFFPNPKDITQVWTGLDEFMNEIMDVYSAEKANKNRQDGKFLRFLDLLIKKLQDVLAQKDEGIEYAACADDKIDLRPLKVYSVFRNYFSIPTLFLSASLLSNEGFRSMIGIKDEEMHWLDLPSPFPVENRPLKYWWRTGARALAFEKMEAELPKLVEGIIEILEKHPSERGIIHTHTYKIADFIYSKIPFKYQKRLQFPKTAFEQKNALYQHERQENSVLISPSMTEGVDLKDALCRFSVLCKVPFMPMNDPVVEARMNANPEWYHFRTAMPIVQAPGRAIRSDIDHAVTYFIDPGFMRFFNLHKKHLPTWFLDGLQKGLRPQ